ncbi:hypothetical protein JCM6882_008358 [Rhodosporidiobolus microsporus]
MLLTLPTELIEHIVRLAIPPEYSSATYLERQDTLRELCLVCRDLRSVAQPVLGEMVRVSKEVTVERVKELFQSTQAKRRIRVLALQGEEVDFDVLGGDCTKLQDVRMSGLGGIDLTPLEKFPALSSLVLKECEVHDHSVSLVGLTSLTWSDSNSSSELPAAFLRPANVPLLRQITYYIDGQNPDNDDKPNLVLSPTLLAQVDTLCLTYPLAGIPIDGAAPLVLLDTLFSSKSSFEFEHFLSRGAKHVRAYVPSSGIEVSNLPTAVDFLTAALSPINTPSASLGLLYLPTRCDPSSCLDAATVTAMEGLVAVCAARGIEVDYEDTDEGPGGSLTSPKFAAYARRLREKERAA